MPREANRAIALEFGVVWWNCLDIPLVLVVVELGRPKDFRADIILNTGGHCESANTMLRIVVLCCLLVSFLSPHRPLACVAYEQNDGLLCMGCRLWWHFGLSISHAWNGALYDTARRLGKIWGARGTITVAVLLLITTLLCQKFCVAVLHRFHAGNVSLTAQHKWPREQNKVLVGPLCAAVCNRVPNTHRSCPRPLRHPQISPLAAVFPLRSRLPVLSSPLRPQGIVFLHSVGVIHADLKPENVALYPPASSRSPISNPTAKSGSHDIRNGNLNNNSYASSSASAMAVDAPVASGTPPPLGTPMTPNTVNHRPSSSSSSARHLDPRPSPEPHQPPPPQPFDLRLIDLGNAVRACDTVPAVTAGTPSYLSPEARAGEAWGPPVDVWAVGCILFEIVTGWRVGSGTAAGGVGGKGAGEGAGLANLQGSVLEGMMDLVKSLLTEDVQSRPSARQALTHPVFSMA